MRTRDLGDIVIISTIAASDVPIASTPHNMAGTVMEALAYSLAKEFPRCSSARRSVIDLRRVSLISSTGVTRR
jgi:hypothetical protein